MQIGFAQGGIGQIIYARGLSQLGGGRRCFVGNLGSLEFQDGAPNILKISTTGEVCLPIPDVDAWQLEVDDFINAVLDGSPMLISPEDARQVVNIAEAAVTSATAGQRIMLQ